MLIFSRLSQKSDFKYDDGCFLAISFQILFGEAALGIYNLQGYNSPGADKTVVTLGVRMHPIIRRTVRFVGKCGSY